MKCHRHPERDAIAICKQCVRGICEECQMDADGSAACSEVCAKRVILAQDALFRAGPVMQRFAGLFVGAFGLGFFAWGLFENDPRLQLFIAGVGLLFLVFSVALGWSLHRRKGLP